MQKQNITKYNKAKVSLAIVTSIAMSMASSTFAWSDNMTIAANVANFVTTPTTTPGASLSLKEKIQKIWNIILGGAEVSKNPLTEEDQARKANLIYTKRQKQYFSDIEDSRYAADINILASKRIVKGYDNKFYPQNHVRLGDFVQVLAKAYMQKTSGTTPVADKQALRDIATSNKRLLGLQTANADQLLDGTDMQTILKNFIAAHGDIVASDLISPASDTIITKEKMAYIVVNLLGLEDNQGTQGDYFTDIANDPAQAAINTLANYDIVENDSKFYPQNNVRRHDFVMMVTKALATAEDKDITFGTSSIADIPQIDAIQSIYAWAQQNGVLDYIELNTKGQTTIDPDAFVTKDEVYQTLKNIAGIKVVIDPASKDDPMTRSELAALLVDVFALAPQDSSDTTDTNTLTQTVRVPLRQLVSKL